MCLDYMRDVTNLHILAILAHAYVHLFQQHKCVYLVICLSLQVVRYLKECMDIFAVPLNPFVARTAICRFGLITNRGSNLSIIKTFIAHFINQCAYPKNLRAPWDRLLGLPGALADSCACIT